jgi:hypothetical protein
MGPTQGGNEDPGSMFLPGMEELAAAEERNTVEREDQRSNNPDMSADANQLNLTNTGAPQVAVAPPQSSTERADRPAEPSTQPPDEVDPVWMRRSKLVIFVMACIYLGIILIILPWNDVWTQNALIHRYPSLRELAMNNFLRGAITGLGFVNIWLGVWEAVGYREHKK